MSVNVGVDIHNVCVFFCSRVRVCALQKENLAVITAQSQQVVFTLLTLYQLSDKPVRPAVLNCLEAYACILGEKEINALTQRVVLPKLLEISNALAAHASSGGGGKAGGEDSFDADSANTQLQDLLDIVHVLLMGDLSHDTVAFVQRTVEPFLSAKQVLLQRKGYQVLCSVLANHWETPGVGDAVSGPGGLVETLSAAAEAVLTPCVHARMACVHEVLVRAVDDDLEVGLAALERFVAEIILTGKEASKKTRDAAFAVVIGVGNATMEHGGDDLDGPNGAPAAAAASAFTRFVLVVVAGLAGTTDYMLSGTVLCLARIVYEFSARMAQQTLSRYGHCVCECACESVCVTLYV
jgi:ribosomal RNA-processing protein 12